MPAGRILIADDDAVIRMDLKTTLESLGHCVVGEADNGETLCYLARSLKPDLTILDVEMPRMSGLEAAEIISRERLGAIILLTAYSDAEKIQKASRAGALAYLVKPFREIELQPTVEIALARYREMLALEGALDDAQGQMEANRIVGRAKRVLIERHKISDQEAYRRLSAQALANSKTLREIADAILLTEDMSMPLELPRKK